MPDTATSLPTQAKVAGGGLAAAIALIIGAVVTVEGGYVDNRNDPGGRTKYGWTEQSARENGYRGDIADLTRTQAIEMYGRFHVTKPGFDGVVRQSVALGHEVIDQGVNMGPHRPSCYLQRALNSLNRQERDYPDVAVDCRVGPATVAAFGALSGKRGNRKACQLVLKLVEAQQGAEYLRLTSVNRDLEDFMVGWADHRLGNVPLARCAEGGAGQ